MCSLNTDALSSLTMSDALQLPRLYRVTRGTRRAVDAVAGLVVVVVVGGLIASLTGVIRNPNSQAFLWLLAISIAAGAFFLALSVHRRQVLLSVASIQVTNLLGSRTMRREEITARRMGRVYRGGSRYVLISRDGKELGLPPYVEYDKAFHAWMKAIPLLKRR
jgi:hypothetical protein